MRNVNLAAGLALLAGVAARNKGKRRSAPTRYTDVFVQSADGRTLYYVDKKGTRRRATAEEEQRWKNQTAAKGAR